MPDLCARAARRLAAVRGGNLVLIGYRGCGKSTVGALLAVRLGWPFVDSDERIAAAAGHAIRTLFAAEGEDAFRDRESAVLAELVQTRGRVLSVGGGAVLRPANRTLLHAAGTCVWLTAPPEELFARLAADPASADQRPPLTGRTPRDEIRHLLAHREPLYAALADHVIDTSGRAVAAVADAVLRAVAAADNA